LPAAVVRTADLLSARCRIPFACAKQENAQLKAVRPMKRILPQVIAGAGILFAGCSDYRPSTKAPGPAEENSAPLDACALLTADEIASVQGEAVRETKPSTQTLGVLTVSQCDYVLPTESNSIVVTLTQASAANASELSKQWSDMFHNDSARAEPAEAGAEASRREVHGLGEQAFWTGSPISGALYVLKGNQQLRISVGGADDVNTKIDKGEVLAEFILQRL
jgi:hypothetical protein